VSGRLLTINDLTPYQFNLLFDLSENIKLKPQKFQSRLQGKIVALAFERPYSEIQVAFEIGLLQLGGNPVLIQSSNIQRYMNISVSDMGKQLERWVDGIIISISSQQTMDKLAASTSFPVINASTDMFHPCQALSDLFTLKEKKGDFSGLSLAFIGAGKNICHSLLYASAKVGAHIKIAAPPGYEPDPIVLRKSEEAGLETGFSYQLVKNPIDAAEGADAVYSGTWPIMGRETDNKNQINILKSFQVNRSVMDHAKADAVYMHPLPAQRGKEVTDEVLGSKHSIIFDQAENRLHVQKAIMLLLLENK